MSRYDITEHGLYHRGTSQTISQRDQRDEFISEKDQMTHILSLETEAKPVVADFFAYISDAIHCLVIPGESAIRFRRKRMTHILSLETEAKPDVADFFAPSP